MAKLMKAEDVKGAHLKTWRCTSFTPWQDGHKGIGCPNLFGCELKIHEVHTPPKSCVLFAKDCSARFEVVEDVNRPTAWNYAQAIKAITATEVQRDCVFNGIRKILEANTSPDGVLCGSLIVEELQHIHHQALATGPGSFTQRLAVTLKMFLANNDYHQAGTGIDKEDSDEIKEARALLELLT